MFINLGRRGVDSLPLRQDVEEEDTRLVVVSRINERWKEGRKDGRGKEKRNEGKKMKIN